MFNLLKLSLIIDKSNSIVKDLGEMQKFNAQYNYDKERIDRLKKEIDARANIMQTRRKDEETKNNNRKR